jgi:nucleotide-binding universal stress UspA family protein
MKTNQTKCPPARERASALRLRKLVVPLDFSPQSPLALKYAGALAQKAGAVVELLFVVEPAAFYSGVEDSPLAVDNPRLTKAARKQLQEHAARLTASGVETRVAIRVGKAFAEICAHAKELKADLIVISTHGYSGMERVLMGSTAEQVVRRAPCAVLALRLDARAGGVRREPHADVPHLRRVLAPVDFSEPSRRALNYAVDFARKFGSHLTVFHVSFSIPPPRRLAAFARGLEVGLFKEAQRDIAKLVKEVVPDSMSVNIEVVAGSPRNGILQAAERTNADLIVIATQGRRGLERWFMGSTAEHTVRYAPCPVLVVRQAGPVGEEPAKRKRAARRRSD